MVIQLSGPTAPGCREGLKIHCGAVDVACAFELHGIIGGSFTRE